MNILATVCARGGSKGLRNKNILPIGGKPLIAWSVDVAKRWGKARRIVCSTDSEEIAVAARAAGAEAPFVRPAELSDDKAGKVAVIRHALAFCEQAGEKYDLVVDLDATAPVRTVRDLDRCLQLFEERRPEVLFSVTRARKNPYFNMVERKSDGNLSVVKTLQNALLRRQDAPQVFDLNASIYFYDARALAAGTYAGVLQSRFDVYEMDDSAAFDIDTELDSVVVEAIMKHVGMI
jgi:CMP-N-acetylneuraminic acid synthetase